ncbi:GGDEF domain-containing protein [Erythrobacter dokdonensis]|uniref:diguanylate cyclase n=1 Tax=Erythrobacter dokdonensis DSW-74 TaxID=1300349 RepID=A0A1A7BJK8_9SPHN|nr:GGDEF domain-containing protein [Erythrobacter dokdonensis]OBV11647.1 Diguanylate cyclase [Erythrobacter dokdonensis DSW-74]
MFTPLAPRTPGALRRHLWRTDLLVVGASVIASAMFAHLSFTMFGTIDYAGTMVAAVAIPLVVASLAFAWIAALTLRLDASRRELERMAHQDPLTGLANRRAALARLEQWAGTPDRIALAIADIDFFKRVNDRLGHDAGDASLVHFAAMLRKLLPAEWLVARIGGEEFLIAARDADFPAFAARIEAVRVAVAQTPLIVSAGPWQMTASFGLAERLAGEPADRMITRADTALYAAKQAGRNRIERAA